MRARWFGMGAFELVADGTTVAVDPFGDLSGIGRRIDYLPVEGVEAQLLLVTHEHRDHNGVEQIGGEPQVIRSTAGTFESPVGEVVGVASEHDEAAGTKRGPNTIFVFSLGGLRVAHFGDFGQAALRPEQREAIGAVDVVFLPVGGGPTVGGEAAAAIVRELAPRVLVPMHFRTPLVDFLDPPDAFLDALGWPVERLGSNVGDVDPGDEPRVVLFEPPVSGAAKHE